jgi:hypothetical protein
LPTASREARDRSMVDLACSTFFTQWRPRAMARADKSTAMLLSQLDNDQDKDRD